MSFRALLITQPDPASKTTAVALQLVDEDQLPQGSVLVEVAWSTLNYKDGLAITGRSPVVRRFPMVPGIDFAGRVSASTDPRWSAGDEVLLNGFGAGEVHWGGLSEKARVPAEWLVRVPDALGMRRAMALGTAGYTAALCVLALQRHGLKPGEGEVLVTGAKGGVGSVAIALLSRLGHRVVASTGRVEADGDYLRKLGAADVIDRAALAVPGKPLQKERWRGVVDAVGSHTLANACAQTVYGGAVTACGLAQGMDLPASVAPFILRAVTLYGIDSVMAPMASREEAWALLADHLPADLVDGLVEEVPLEGAIAAAARLMDGGVRGRIVVRVSGDQ